MRLDFIGAFELVIIWRERERERDDAQKCVIYIYMHAR